METKNIMIVGVGGQGSLLASKLLGHLLLTQGYDVKVSEVHGMSQRGGSVVTYVRWGDRVASPVIDEGQADFIVSFEVLESARWLPYLKKDGQIVTNTQQIDPMPVVTGAAKYPARRSMPWTVYPWPLRPALSRPSTWCFSAGFPTILIFRKRSGRMQLQHAFRRNSSR